MSTSWTTEETNRIIIIERKLNELQTAMTRLATISQMKQLLLLRQQEIDEMQDEITSIKAQIAVLQA